MPGRYQAFYLSVYKLTSYNDVFIDFCVDSMSLTTSFKKTQRHDDLIKAHAVIYATFIRATCNNAVSMRGD